MNSGVLIIHIENHTDREPFIADLKEEFGDNVEIIPAVIPSQIDQKYWLDLKRFTRMPTLNIQSSLARVSCFLSHKKALEYARQKDWDSVIIFEDDAYKIDLLPDLTDVNMAWLGYRMYKDKPIQAHAMYYSKEAINHILDKFETRKPKAYDMWVYDHRIRSKVKLFDCYRQASGDSVPSLLNSTLYNYKQINKFIHNYN